jgi:Caspase activity and apoptosis inhibitor 1
MAPTQAFKPRALRISDGHRPLQSERSRTKHAASSNHDRSRRTSKHRSDSLRSKSREGHKRAKLNRRYDEVKKLDVAMDPDAVSGSEDENGSDLHLDKPMYNIGEYLKDRAALVRNMFASLKKDTLSRMIPSVLREFSLEELGKIWLLVIDRPIDRSID